MEAVGQRVPKPRRILSWRRNFLVLTATNRLMLPICLQKFAVFRFALQAHRTSRGESI
jgi:hypothetical protein